MTQIYDMVDPDYPTHPDEDGARGATAGDMQSVRKKLDKLNQTAKNIESLMAFTLMFVATITIIYILTLVTGIGG